jgi:hypothetical protein
MRAVLERLDLVARAGSMRETRAMTVTESRVAGAFVAAIVARDFARAVALLHPEIDFRAMTPNRVWEAEGPAGVEAVLRTWLDDPDEDVEGIEPTEPSSIEDTVRVGWLVRVSDVDGPHIFEQQAYVRERDAQIDWMRVMCSGWIPLPQGEPALSAVSTAPGAS